MTDHEDYSDEPRSRSSKLKRNSGSMAWFNNILDYFNEEILVKKDSEEKFIPYSILPLVGWGLFLYSILQLYFLIWPLNVTNTQWEFEVMVNISDIAVYTFSGIGLILFNKPPTMTFINLKSKALISWLSLVLGVIYLMIIPLGIRDTDRLFKSKTEEYTNKRAIISDNIVKGETVIMEAESKDVLLQISASANLLKNLQDRMKIKPDESIESVKLFLKNELIKNGDNVLTQWENNFLSEKNNILKFSIKLNICALLFGILFIWMWKVSAWTRLKHSS